MLNTARLAAALRSCRAQQNCEGDQVVPTWDECLNKIPTDDFIDLRPSRRDLDGEQVVPTTAAPHVLDYKFVVDWNKRSQRVFRKIITARALIEADEGYSEEDREAVRRNIMVNRDSVLWAERQIEIIVETRIPNPRLEKEADELLSALETTSMNIRAEMGSF